ncbi:hypothetical protein AX14_006674 [Amanita brunnescens Koide BX004]|nr:hypothetical protein AX14_006674 [Amanita brunnescens Koide BX004]
MLDKSHHELELFKVQLNLANQEVRKAEETVMRIDRARLRAEEQAARERAKVRQLMEKIAIDDALHQGREIGFREGLERGKMLGWAELMTRRGLDDRETGRQSRQSISRPSSASSNPARRGSTPRPQNTDLDPLPVRPPSRKQNTGTPVSVRLRSSSIKQPQPIQASSLPENSNVHTTPRQHGTPSATHPPYQIPPDGYIPIVADGSVISLPPPHELTRHFNPTPIDIRPQGGRPGSAHSSRRNDMQGSETGERSRTPGTARSPSTVSGGSRSTTISQYEFVRAPHTQAFSDENSLNSIDERSSTGPPAQIPNTHLNTGNAYGRLTPSNSPAIYHRPLRDELENERSLDGNETFLSSKASSEVNIGVVSASNTPSHTTRDSLFAESGFLGANHHHTSNRSSRRTETPDAELTTNLIVLPTNELPPGFVLSPLPTQSQLP